MKEIYNMGIRGHIAMYIINFLTNRECQVNVGNVLSQTFVQEQGTPHGSVLSCTLFMIATNNIAVNLPQPVSATMYVDDLAIYLTANSLATAQRLLQNAID